MKCFYQKFNYKFRNSISHKFSNIIALIYNESKQKLVLPEEVTGKGVIQLFKIAQSNSKIDYTYWNDLK